MNVWERRFRAAVAASLFFPPATAAALPSELDRFFSIPGRAVIDLYRRFSGKGRQSTCPMFPSCSTFARDAFEAQPAARATLLAADRLHRCGHDLGHYPLVLTEEGPKYHDPVPR